MSAGSPYASKVDLTVTAANVSSFAHTFSASIYADSSNRLADDTPQPTEDPLIAEAEKAVDRRCCSAYVRDEPSRRLQRCGLPVFAEFDWPGGSKPQRQCLIHTIKAIHVAAVLGFRLSARRCEEAEAAEDTQACASPE